MLNYKGANVCESNRQKWEILTLEPGRLFLVSRLIVVSDVVKVAVNIEQMQIPIRIQHTAKVLPNREMGARSPYLCFHTRKKQQQE